MGRCQNCGEYHTGPYCPYQLNHAGLVEGVERLHDVLLHAGFTRCDIPACNCGSWHHRYGLRERMDEICSELRDADVLDNSTGNLPLNAVRKLRQRAEAAETKLVAAERDAGRLVEAVRTMYFAMRRSYDDDRRVMFRDLEHVFDVATTHKIDLTADAAMGAGE